MEVNYKSQYIFALPENAEDLKYKMIRCIHFRLRRRGKPNNLQIQMKYQLLKDNLSHIYYRANQYCPNRPTLYLI